MKKSAAVTYGLGGILAATLIYVSYPWTDRINYRIRVSVETPRGPIVGESVRQVISTKRPWWDPFGASRINGVEGEAVVLRVSRDERLIALLRGKGDGNPYSDHPIYMLRGAFPDVYSGKVFDERHVPGIR